MSGYLLSTFGGGFMDKGREYMAAEDIRDVLQLIELINQRPCVLKTGERMTSVSYRELFAMKKRLSHAVTQLNDVIADFRRPLGATPTDGAK